MNSTKVIKRGNDLNPDWIRIGLHQSHRSSVFYIHLTKLHFCNKLVAFCSCLKCMTMHLYNWN